MEMNAFSNAFSLLELDFEQILPDSRPSLFLSESRGPTTACATLHNAVSDVIQHVELTERRIILVIARFVTMQSSRPLFTFKHVKSPSKIRELLDLNLCYLSSDAGADQNHSCHFSAQYKTQLSPLFYKPIALYSL